VGGFRGGGDGHAALAVPARDDARLPAPALALPAQGRRPLRNRGAPDRYGRARAAQRARQGGRGAGARLGRGARGRVRAPSLPVVQLLRRLGGAAAAVNALPEVAELLPHAGPMRLLERVEQHDGARTCCRVWPAASALFLAADGRVPSWVALEWMAQCAAAHGGLAARARGEAPRAGVLVGSRRICFRCDAFAPDTPLRVSARLAAGHGDRF